MKITKVETFPLTAKFADMYGEGKVPEYLTRPAASYREYKRQGQCSTIVKITGDDGHYGIGEAYGLPDPRLTALIIDVIVTPLLLGRDPRNINALQRTLDIIPQRGGHSRGFMMEALSGVNQALWDLKGKLLNVPIYSLLGGKLHDRIDCYASPIMLYPTTEESQQRARELIGRGFTAVKLKIGRGLRQDLDHIAAVREAVGKDVRLLLDANCGYDRLGAIDLAHQLREFDIYWLEEPVIAEDVEGLAQVRKVASTAIATGENECSFFGFRHIAQLRAADILMPNLARVGGVSGGQAIHYLCHTHALYLAPHGVGSAINLAATLQVMAASSASSIYEYNQLLSPLREDLLVDFPRFDEGFLHVPDAPGLGVELNWDVVERYRTPKDWSAQ